MASHREPAGEEPTRGRFAPMVGPWLFPSLTDLFFVMAVAVAVLQGGYMVSADGDPARHLTVGEHMLSSGRILGEDIFSYTKAGAAFVPYEWLAEVASAASYRLAGLAGPPLIHGATIGLTFAVLLRHSLARGHGVLLASSVTLLALVASMIHWIARPHVFTFLGTAIFAAILDGWYSGRLASRRLWLLPIVTVVWANLHGGFLVGLVLIGVYVSADILRFGGSDAIPAGHAVRRLRVLVPVGLLALAATLVTPAGFGLFGHVTGYLGKRLLVDRTAEYLSPNFHRPEFNLFLAMLLAVLLGLAWARRRPSLHEGLLLMTFSAFALYSGRNVPLFAIVAAPILVTQLSALPIPGGALARRGGRLSGWLKRRNATTTDVDASLRGHFWPAATLIVLMTVAGVQVRAGVSPLDVKFDTTQQPVEAVEYLKGHLPSGNVFNALVWGGFVLHELWPGVRVFIDGQTDFYGEALTTEYLRVTDLRDGWRDVLDQYDVRWVLYHTDSPLVRELARTPGWRVSYQDSKATVLER